MPCPLRVHFRWTARGSGVRRTALAPELPSKIGLMNEREAPESGPPLKMWIAPYALNWQLRRVLDDAHDKR
jgi:hypothetical protein